MNKKERIILLEERVEMLVARISYVEYKLNDRIPKGEYVLKGNQLVYTTQEKGNAE